MNRSLLSYIILFLFFIPNFIFAQTFVSKIRIGILSKISPGTVRIIYKNARVISGTKTFPDRNSSVLVRAESDQILIVSRIFSQKTNHLLFSGGQYELLLPGSETPRYYAGDLEISSLSGKLKFILTVPREDYVSEAIISEFGELLVSKNETKPWKEEYKTSAEAVIRSYTLANLGRHSKEGYDLCDLTHCLHYSGKNIKDKIQEGFRPKLVLKDPKNRPLETFFHSTCGGNLSSPSVFWKNFGENSKLFRSGKDIWKGNEIQCRNSPHFVWETLIDKNEMEEILNSKNISDFSPSYEEKRVTRFDYSDSFKKKNIPISEFLSRMGKRFGWNRTKSNDFIMETGSKGFFFRGKGLGHGIGLCQYGAKEMAIRGAKSKEILNFYYPRAIIEVLP